MEGHFSTGQSPQWAVVPTEEEEEEEYDDDDDEEEEDVTATCCWPGRLPAGSSIGLTNT